MNYMNTIDLSLQLNRVSWQVLHGLSGEPDFAPYADKQYLIDTETYTFYNCRERGFTLQISYPRVGDYLFVSFAEQRNSDSVVVYTWTRANMYVNPPTPDDLNEADARASGCTFRTVSEAVKYIQTAAGRYLETIHSRKTANDNNQVAP